ncbi:MAG: hypothetical protein VR68_11500 [Peptococcaceae bacterium BRH_c4a]|nr:MAG: hypothetical protein VR68_11500 [Peptococcaceae bacterium BRH_c4a]
MTKELTTKLTTNKLTTSTSSKLSFRIHPEYDAELIAHLSGMDKGKKSRELRRIIRAGLRVVAKK